MSVFKAVKCFVRDDAGNAAISDVAILAVGATVLLGVLAFWNGTLKVNIESKIQEIVNGGAKAG